MDKTPDPSTLFADVDQILSDAQDQITEETRTASIANLGQFFKMTPRQSGLILQLSTQSMQHAASQSGLDIVTFLSTLTPMARISMLAFTAGAVHQHDIDHLLDPETGERLA